MTDLYLRPALAFKIEAVQVVDIVVVPSTENVQLVGIDGSCMTPPCAWHCGKSATEVNTRAVDNTVSAVGLNEHAQVENVDVIEVLVFAMAASEGDNAILAHSRDCMEPFARETCCLARWVAIQLQLEPDKSLQIQCPNVIQV